MTTFLLLHGSFHAAWNWHRLVPALKARGQRALALDLPGHGLARISPDRVSLEGCVRAVTDAIDACDSDVVLMAHSRNGIVISQAAEARPERLRGLVYLAAYLIPPGRSMMDYAVLDPDSLVLRNVDPPFDRRRVDTLRRLFRRRSVRALLPRLLPLTLQQHTLRPEAYREALYHDCGSEITELASVLLEPESNWPGFTPLVLTPQRYGRVPKVYIECSGDRAVTLALQRRMQRDSPCDHVITLGSGHSPFFSQPGPLADALVESDAVFERLRRDIPLPVPQLAAAARFAPAARGSL